MRALTVCRISQWGGLERWRARFVAKRLDGLQDEPRPGRPSSILLDQVENVVVATLESTPGKDSHWSRTSKAKRTGLSKSTIGRIWKKSDLRPHLQDAFKWPGTCASTSTSPRPTPPGSTRSSASLADFLTKINPPAE
ncbi:helix-turn-helix domain-containing protein [Streptomyces sp. CBMA123]|uniref:helix-turn-helix domain-containing protein n=1 Tax=Streptomyces sp. CBMA123 TaxID=1896313 RepID=UPI00294FFD93|nr:helix-turn-helix domain-containing protein [Streptomyces sp. CBMA123]